MPPRSPTIVGSAVDTIVWSSDASSSTSRSAPKIRRTRSRCGASAWATPLMRRILGVPFEVAAAALQPAQLRVELAGELVEPLPPCADERELPFDERDRLVDDAQALVVARRAGPAASQHRARLLGLGELDQLLEREAEQVAEPDQLLEPHDVGLGVVAVRSLRARAGRAQQPALLVVADRPRGDAHALGHLADAERPLLDRAPHRVHAASSTGSSPVGAAAGEVAASWWYLPPRSSDATAATRHAAIANTNA